MSKLAKKPILILEGITLTTSDGLLIFKGPIGELKIKQLDYVDVALDEARKNIILKVKGSHKQARANIGTMAALIKNAIQGVKEGYVKELEIEGVAYRASLSGNKLTLSVGFSHTVDFEAPASIKLVVEKNTIKISGPSKEMVGEVAAKIRRIKPPEPYQGKGIRYKGEVIRRKAGKKAVGTAA